MLRSFVLSLIFLTAFNLCSSAQKKEIKDWKNSPQAIHDKLISQANGKKFVSLGMVVVGVSVTLGGVAKSISPAFKEVPKTDIRVLWMPVAGILTTIAAYPMARSGRAARKKAWQVLEQSASMGNPSQPFIRYPAIGLQISL